MDVVIPTNTSTVRAQPSAPSEPYSQTSNTTLSAAPVTGLADTVSLSDNGLALSAASQAGIDVSQKTLGQYFAPLLFSSADANQDRSLSKDEFQAFSARNNLPATDSSAMYAALGGTDEGLSFESFEAGVGLPAFATAFNNIITGMIGPASADPARVAANITALMKDNRDALAALQAEGTSPVASRVT